MRALAAMVAPSVSNAQVKIDTGTLTCGDYLAMSLECQFALKAAPVFALNVSPYDAACGTAAASLVGVAEPRLFRCSARRRVLSVDGQARFLKRQLSLPVSTMSQ